MHAGWSRSMLVDNEYFDAWMAAIDEMRRPDWREVLVEGRRDAASGRGRSLDVIAKELGLEGPSKPKSRSAAGRTPSARRKKNR